METFLAAATLFGAVWAIVLERHWFAVRRFSIPCLPVGSDPMTILHISDLHFRKGQGLKRRFLRGLSKLEPDYVVATGDFLGDRFAVDSVLAALAPIAAKRGSIFVLGSNDYYSPMFKSPLRYFAPPRRLKHKHGKTNPWPDLVRGLVDQGWTYLSNRVVELDGIDVVGLDDAHIGRAKPEVATTRTESGFRLALAHTPDSARDLLEKGYDLVLCGHTHGGQVRLPFSGPIVTNCDIPREWARGVQRVGDSWLHVSAGLGTSKFAPYRFACRPEVSLLQLTPRTSDVKHA